MRFATVFLFIAFIGAVDKAPESAVWIMAGLVALGLERTRARSDQ